MPSAARQVVGAMDSDDDEDNLVDGEPQTFLDPNLERAQAAEARVTELVDRIPGGSAVLQAIRSLPFDLGRRPVPILAGLVGLLLLISLAALFGGSGAAPVAPAVAAVALDGPDGPPPDAVELPQAVEEEVPEEGDLEGGAPLCSPGKYISGKGVCETCDGGTVRRRRAKSCTPCPPGQFDFGDHDDCFEVSYWASYDGVDCEGSTLNGESFSTILDAKQRCIELGQACIGIQDSNCDGSTRLLLCDGNLVTSTEDLNPSQAGGACTRVKESFQSCDKFNSKNECKLPRCIWEGQCIEVFELGMMDLKRGMLCQKGGTLVKDAQACKMAAVTLGKRWIGQVNKANKGRGCYMERSLTVGWNSFLGGQLITNGEALPVCFKARKCPMDWYSSRNHNCYRAWPDQVSWIQGERECVHHGGHLASVQSAAESKEISVLLDGDWAWVGHNLSGGSMAWSDGSSSGYLLGAANWASGGAGKSGDCGLISPEGVLGDNVCDAKLRFVCRYIGGPPRKAGGKRLLQSFGADGGDRRLREAAAEQDEELLHGLLPENLEEDDEELSRRLRSFDGRFDDDAELSVR